MTYLFSVNSKPFLLDQNFKSDSPVSVYKSLWQIWSENYHWVIILLLTLLTASVLVFLFRKKDKNKNNKAIDVQIDPFDEAISAIQELQRNKLGMAPKPFVFRLSEILRIYVQKRFKMPAMELTGEEFIIETASNPFFKNRYEDLLREFVDRGDRVKYSKETASTIELNLLLDSALHFVTDSHSRISDQESPLHKRNSSEMETK
jgi:hypothetical protein